LEFSTGGTGAPAAAVAKGGNNEKLRLILVALIALVAGGWIVSMYLPKKHEKEVEADAPKTAKPIAKASPVRQLSEQERDEKIRIARIQFEVAERYFADGNVSDANLYKSVKIYEKIVA